MIKTTDEMVEAAQLAADKLNVMVPATAMRAALSAALAQVKEEPVGEAGEMPGSNGGFTMAVFKCSDVPIGSKLYLHPARVVETILDEEEAALTRYRDEDCQGDSAVKQHAWVAADSRISEIIVIRRKLRAALRKGGETGVEKIGGGE